MTVGSVDGVGDGAVELQCNALADAAVACESEVAQSCVPQVEQQLRVLLLLCRCADGSLDAEPDSRDAHHLSRMTLV